jgi:archaemetzincin
MCSIFLAVMLSGLFLSWLGAQVDCPTGDEEPVEALCTCPFVKVSLQPYADFTQKEVQQLKNELEKHLRLLIGEVGLEFEILPNKPLSAELKNDVGTRYRADKIINSLASDADRNHVIIALTHKDISVSYKGKSDWGVLGLSLIPKKACVVSTFRVRNRKDLWKVASHEFIHTCFEYQHCPDDNPKCLMKDAKGHADFSGKSTLCEKCSKRIYDHFNLQARA